MRYLTAARWALVNGDLGHVRDEVDHGVRLVWGDEVQALYHGSSTLDVIPLDDLIEEGLLLEVVRRVATEGPRAPGESLSNVSSAMEPFPISGLL